MAITTIPLVVTGTGRERRAQIIRAHCREGAPVEVRRSSSAQEDEALEVWLCVSRLFGINKSWKKIGYVEGSRYRDLARELENGRMTVRRSVIDSFFAPLDREQPQVAVELEVEWTAPEREMSTRRPRLRHVLQPAHGRFRRQP